MRKIDASSRSSSGSLASPRWHFDDKTFDRSAASLDNPDHVAITIHNYRWRQGLAEGEPKFAALEQRLAEAPIITVPTITMEGDANGAPHPEPSAYAGKFSGKYEHRDIGGGVGHNLPQEAPAEFAKAVIDVDHFGAPVKLDQMHTPPKDARGAGAEQRLQELGLELPPPPEPFGAYAEAVQSGSLLFLTGMLPTEGRAAKFVGRLGAEFDVQTGRKAAHLAALNALAVVRQQLGSLDRVARLVRLGLFIATAGDFREHPQVADGASELLQNVFGKEKNPCRSVYGVASLPLGAAVELELTVEVLA